MGTEAAYEVLTGTVQVAGQRTYALLLLLLSRMQVRSRKQERGKLLG